MSLSLEVYSIDNDGLLQLDAVGKPLVLTLDRSELPEDYANVCDRTLALQRKAGFQGHCVLVPCSVTEINESHIQQHTPQVCEKSDDKGKDWPQAAVMLLITCYEECVDKFRDSRLKKKEVWEMVSKLMSVHQCTYGGQDCAKKWSNLELRYKRILDNNSKTGRGAKKPWMFFERMDAVCGERASSVSLKQFEIPTKRSRDQCPPSKPLQPTTSTSSSSAANIQVSEDDDDADVISGEALNLKADKVVSRKKRRTCQAPEWFASAEEKMSKDQKEWREEMMKRLDNQERQQAERMSLLKETNNLLRQLVNRPRNEP